MATEPRAIVVVGGGGHAKVLLHVLSRLSGFRVLGYVDPRDNGALLGFPRLGGDDKLPELAKQGASAALGVGKVRAGGERLKLLEKLRGLGFALPAIVAPSAIVAGDVALGAGTVVFDGAVVQPGCSLGAAVIVNTGALVDHDCMLADDVHVATGARLSGGVTIGAGSLVGVGASVIQLARIGTGCTVGAGAAVAGDCLEPGTYVGVPARKVGS